MALEANNNTMLFIFDMDGVLYRGKAPIPHAAEAIATLREAGHTVRFLTNNAWRPRAEYIPFLAGMDISCTMDEIITSAHLLARHFVDIGLGGRTVHVVGGEGLREELKTVAKCHLIVGEDPPADAVAVGIDREFTYDRMRIALLHIQRGARFFSTNRDATFPVEGGAIVPGAGSIVAAIATAASCEPLNIGKPNPLGTILVAKLAGVPISETVVIGDRLDTDIAAGVAAGVMTVMVLTGVNTRDEAMAAPPEQTPGIIIEDLSCLPKDWIG
jgi:4-nitrophenyl phosphatase